MLALSFVWYCLLALCKIHAQVFDTTNREVGDPGFPTGVASFPGEWHSGIPIPCVWGCFNPGLVYYSCFLNTTLDDGRQANQNECNDFLCDKDNYDQLVACLNCVVANGNERPYGYHTNSSLTAPATDNPLAPTGIPMGGYMDLEQANGWLANITARCRSAGSAIAEDSETTITASPTTTGPVFTAWSSGQTLRFTTWTGLTQFSDQFYPVTTPVYGPLQTESTVVTTSGSSSGEIASTSASTSGTSDPLGLATSSGTPRGSTVADKWLLLALGLSGLL